MIVLSILTTILGCPNEVNCNKCVENDTRGKCEFCYRGFLDKNSACTLTQKQDTIDYCEMYQPRSVSLGSLQNAACKTCEYGYFLQEGICKKCKMSGCAVCSNEDDCSACLKGRKVVTEDKVMKCSDLENDVPNCEICQYSSSRPEFKCLQCKSTYALNEKALARHGCHSTSVKNCLVLVDDSDEKCKFCDLDYFIDTQGKCQSNNQTHWYGYWWFWVLLLLVIGLLIGGSMFYYNKKYMKDRQLVEYLGN